MKRVVRWSDAAIDDLEVTFEYIAATDPDSRQQVVDRIRLAGTKLGEFASGHPGRLSGIYEKPVPKTRHIIAYALEKTNSGNALVILRVIHASRNWPEGEWPE